MDSYVIEHFPQDVQCGAPQKVLPLVVIKSNKFKAIRKRIKRQYEKKKSQKLNEENM